MEVHDLSGGIGEGAIAQAVANYFAANPVQGMPPGVPFWFAGDTPPAGSLLRDGSAVSRTEYADLFAAIGTRYGVGDGSTTFNLPNDVETGNPDGGYFICASNDIRAVGTKAVSRNKAHGHGIRGDSGGIPDWFGGSTASYGMVPTGGTLYSNYIQPDGGADAMSKSAAYLPCISC